MKSSTFQAVILSLLLQFMLTTLSFAQNLSILGINFGMSMQEIVNTFEEKGAQCRDPRNDELDFDGRILCSKGTARITISTDHETVFIEFSCEFIRGCQYHNPQVYDGLADLFDLKNMKKAVLFSDWESGFSLRSSIVEKMYCEHYEYETYGIVTQNGELCQPCYESNDKSEYLCVDGGYYSDGWDKPDLQFILDRKLQNKPPLELLW